MRHLKIYIIGIIILTPGIIHSQIKRSHIGIECSPSLISLRGNEVLTKYNHLTIGYTMGICFQYNLNEIIALRTNISYERKGSLAKFSIRDTLANQTSEISTRNNFEYLTAPILIRLTFGKKIKYFFNAGPYFGYLLKQTFVTKGKNIPTSRIDNTFRDKRFDTGLSMGVGFYKPFRTNGAFTFEIRNNLGLYNVSEVLVINNGTIKTNSFNILFGYVNTIGKKYVKEKRAKNHR